MSCIPKLLIYPSRGKLKVEDDQGQCVCTLRVKEREGRRGEYGRNRILTYIYVFFFVFFSSGNGNYSCQVVQSLAKGGTGLKNCSKTSLDGVENLMMLCKTDIFIVIDCSSSEDDYS